ncbi:MAG TPA: sulfotransferase [Gammaproteobacteria bacterium]|nr:sulfotransferase [Gammaproteobacteria bacterium]
MAPSMPPIALCMSKPPADWIRGALADAYRALQAGDLERSGRLCRRVLDAAPDLAEAHFLVGMVALELSDRPTARAAFVTVTRLRPQHGAAWAHCAWLEARAGRIREARTHLAHAMAHAGDSAAVADLVGTTLALCGDHDAARGWHERAIAANPERIDYRLNGANADLVTGALDAAINKLKDVLARAPGHVRAHWLLAGLAPARDRTHADTLGSLIEQSPPGTTARAALAYARGKLLEDLGDWPGAFAAYSEGAAARRATLAYDEAAEEALFAALRTTYDAQWLSARSGGIVDASPIFIIGQPRTGTTLIERMLAAHPEVHAAGELQFFGRVLRQLAARSSTSVISASAPSGARSVGGRARSARLSGGLTAELVTMAAAISPGELGRAYLEAVAPVRGGRARFIDKLPGNFVHVPHILAALPHARIVHVTRDPLDACFASFKQLFADAYPHSYDQVEQARHFVRYHALMAHWREQFPGRFFDLAYEEVTAAPAIAARRLLEYLDLPWNDACLDFHAQSGAVATASAVQVRQPVHVRSVDRARSFGAALDPMRAVLASAGLLSARAARSTPV